MSTSKNELRARIQQRMAALTSSERQQKSADAFQRLLDSGLLATVRTLMAYDSFGTELETQALLSHCIISRITLALPHCEPLDCSMEVLQVKSLMADLEVGRQGFRQPRLDMQPVELERIDFILVPGIAFDMQCNRMGRGAGYYDRFLSNSNLRATTCAMAYDCQIVPLLDVEPHDIGVDFVFTETRVITANRNFA